MPIISRSAQLKADDKDEEVEYDLKKQLRKCYKVFKLADEVEDGTFE